MMNVESWEPGDMTRYVIAWGEVAPFTAGVGPDGGWLITVINMMHVLLINKGFPVFWIDVEEAFGKNANPWTIRAVMLWLKQSPLDVEVGEIEKLR